MKQILIAASLLFPAFGTMLAQTTTCPAPVPGAPDCYQTSRPNNGNPLNNWPPIPNQDCCNAIYICNPIFSQDIASIIPSGAPVGTLFPGCVPDELPNDANTCFSNNEKGTTWYKFQVGPLNLPGFSSTPGSPAGKLRFKIIPKDVVGVPGYDQFTDNGQISYGNTDFDFLLFKIPASANSEGTACTQIRNSTALGTANSVIASCNWTGTRGPTGLFEPGTGIDSAGFPAYRFNLPLDVKVGDVFYLAIDNYSVNDQGFDVDFRGFEAPDEFTAQLAPTAIITPLTSQSDFNPLQYKFSLSGEVRCDSVKPGKFKVISQSQPNCSILTIGPQDSGAVSASVFLVSFNMVPMDASLKVIGLIRNDCGQFLDTNILTPVQTAFFLQQPVNQNAIVNTQVKFTVKTYGQAYPRRWQIRPTGSTDFYELDDGVGVFSGVFSDTLRISAALLDYDNFSFRCSFLPAGLPAFYSSEALLNVLPEPFMILQQPSIQTVNLGEGAMFTVKTSDPGVPRKWQRNQGFGGWSDITDGSNFSGSATDSLRIFTALASFNNNLFRCRFSPPEYPEQFSNPATLFVPNQELLKSVPLRIFPNPATENRLQLSGRAQEFRLQNLLGQTEISRREINGEESVDIRHLPDGVYFIIIENRGQRWVSKLVVQR